MDDEFHRSFIINLVENMKSCMMEERPKICKIFIKQVLSIFQDDKEPSEQEKLYLKINSCINNIYRNNGGRNCIIINILRLDEYLSNNLEKIIVEMRDPNLRVINIKFIII